MMSIGMRVKKPSGQTLSQQAISILRRLSSSPAGISDSKGYLQTPANLLTWSNDFTNAAWFKNNVTLTNNQENGATKISMTATLARHSIYSDVVTSVSGVAYTSAFLAKAAELGDLTILGDSAQFATAYPTARFNLLTGSVAQGNGTISPVGDGWYLCCMSSTANAVFPCRFSAIVGTNTDSVMGDGASGILIHKAALFQGTYTAAQIQAMGGIPLTTSTASAAVYTNASVYLPGIGTLSGLSAGNYLDSAGTTLGTVDNPVGLVLDAKGDISLVTFEAAGPARITVSDMGGGVTKATMTGADPLVPFICNLALAGKTFKTSCEVWTDSGQPTDMSIFSYDTNTSEVVQTSQMLTTTPKEIVQIRSFSQSNAAVSATFRLDGIDAPNAGEYFYYRNFKIEEITGIHGTQPTTAAKPRLERGARNLLLWSQDFTNAAWLKTDTTPVRNQVGVDGTPNTATLFTEGVAGSQQVTQTISTTNGTFTQATILKRGNNDWVFINVYENGSFKTVRAFLNLATGVLGAVNNIGGSGATASVVGLGNGFFLIALSGTISPNSNAVAQITAVNANDSLTRVNNATYVVQSCGLFAGTLTAQQIIDNGGIPLTTTAAASNPNAGRYSWAFDGGDSLALGSVPFQMGDDFAVIVVASAQDNLNYPRLFSVGNNVVTDQCGLNLSLGAVSALLRAGGTAATIDDVTLRGGTTFVATIVKRVSTLFLRINGVSVGSASTAAVGSNTFTLANIGCNVFAGDIQYHKGSISCVLPLKGTLSDADLLTLERLVSSLTPNAPTF